MAATKSDTTLHNCAADSAAAVTAFLATLSHSELDLIQAIRATILATDSRIAEGVKWNAPSFRTTEYFATTNLREKHGVGVILHLGAKVRDLSPEGITIDDPKGLLKWLARDRAMVVFGGMEDFRAKQAAFQDILGNWITHV